MGVTMTPPDGGWGWIVVLGVSLINLSTRPIEPSFGLLFGDLLNDLSIATTGAGVIVSSYEAVINFSGLLVGPLIKSYSYRKVCFYGSLLTGLGLMATYPAASMGHILTTYSLINGLGIGFSSAASFVCINQYFKKRRGQAVGITMTGTGLGLLLMPQAVRYLTEEYHFTGSMLILGAFALNACVGSALLQPIKWHLRPLPEDKEKALPLAEETKPACPQITITHTIEEEDAEEDDGEATPLSSNGNVHIVKENQCAEKEERTRRLSDRFYLKLERKFSLIDKDHKYPDHGMNKLNKSSTEPKFDKYFDESLFGGRKLSEVRHEGGVGDKGQFARRRKGSTISNLSNLDFHGSCLHLHAMEQELQDNHSDQMDNNNAGLKPGTAARMDTMWKRFSTFMDLDLLKDPIYLNILFGMGIFYVAELNFKMVVPFFLADLGHSKSETAFCLSMMAAADIVARVVLPTICDCLDHRKIITRRTMFMTAAIFCAVSRSALAEVGDWIQLETILIISGFFRGATLINFMLVISEYCEGQMDKLPAAFGIHMVAKGIFIVTLGPLIGVIRDESQSYPLCIHAQSSFILLCCAAWSIEYLITAHRNKSQSKTNQMTDNT